MKKALFGKGLVIGIVVLFFGVNTIASSTLNINNNLFFELEEIESAIWDNDMDYIDMVPAQWDESINFDFFLADDFLFENIQEINDVHWIGGYWGLNYSGACYDWYISFMRDDGSGCFPDSNPQTPSFAGPFCYSWDDISKEIIEDTGSYIYYEMSVDLPEGVIFTSFDKFWISIWAEGAYPPISGWGYHYDYMLKPAVLGSDYYNFSFWTPGNEFLGFDFDMCFQLTGWPNLPPSAPVIDGPSFGKPGEEYCIKLSSIDPDGDNVIYYIDWGDGTFEDWIGPFQSGDNVTKCHTYPPITRLYEIRVKVKDIYGAESGWGKIYVFILNNRMSDNLFFLRLLDSYPILRKLFVLL